MEAKASKHTGGKHRTLKENEEKGGLNHMHKGMAAPERRDGLILRVPTTSTGRSCSDGVLRSGGAHLSHETWSLGKCSSAIAPVTGRLMRTARPTTAVGSPERTPSCVARNSLGLGLGLGLAAEP